MKFSFMNVQCNCACRYVTGIKACARVIEMHKIVQMRKQACYSYVNKMWNACVRMNVSTSMQVSHVKAKSKICEEGYGVCLQWCELVTKGCHHAKKVCKQIVSFWLLASNCETSDGDLCIFFEHLQLATLNT